MANAAGRPRLVIAGGGAAGTLTALHLARTAGRRATPIEIVIIDPDPRLAAGVAFGTYDERHLLNVPAAGMSAFPENPGHFVHWRRQTAPRAADPYEFAPRRGWSRYLQAQLDEAVTAGSGQTSIRHIQRTSTGVTWSKGVAIIRLDDGSSLTADGVVIATGLPVTGASWAPPKLQDSAFFIADPWAPGSFDLIRRDRSGPADVLVVGSGLTMVDVALSLAGSRDGRELRAISRRGVLPHVHADRLTLPAIPDISQWGESLQEFRTHVAEHLRSVEQITGEWRTAVDGLRFRLTELWHRLTEAERLEFLAQDAATWGNVRHRMAPSSRVKLDEFLAEGLLSVNAATLVSAEPLSRGGLAVQLSDGSSHHVGWVVNCTGPQLDISLLGNPLLDDLLKERAVLSTAGMGFRTDNGRLIDQTGSTDAPIWTLGALRRGDLWESTAIPEIRSQALALSTEILDVLAPQPRRVSDGRWVRGDRPFARPRDLLGLPLSTTADAATEFNIGLDRLMRVQPGAEQHFAEAARLDPEFALAYVALAFLGHEGGADLDQADALAQARIAITKRGDNRERSLLRVFEERQRDVRHQGRDVLLAHIAEYPRDVLAVSAAVPTIAFSGVVDVQAESWALVEGLAPAYGDHWWYISLLAFVREEQGQFEEATLLAESAWSCEPSSGHAVHALTHALYETGQHEFGRGWLDHWVAENGRTASHQAHFAWHAALHELSLLDLDAVQARYDSQLAEVRGVRALVDSASLLWRWRVAVSDWPGLDGVEPPAADGAIERTPAEFIEQPRTPFIAFHAAVGLAAAGDEGRLLRLAEFVEESEDSVQAEVIAPVARGLASFISGDVTDAVRVLSGVLPELNRLGGSAAQREVIEDTLLLALVQHGESERAAAILTERLERRESPLDEQRLATLR